MRQILSLSIVIVICSCGQNSKSTKIRENGVTVDSIHKIGTPKTNELNLVAWEKHEDSLRKQILNRKENRILKESFLQEMYIRNVATVSDNNLFMKIPFNLHGPDCVAPDCYSTDISFNFKLGNILIFPKNVQFQEHEQGCIDKGRQLTGVFQLVEQTDRHVIYHSTKPKRTLVLFSSNKENGTTAYYFTEVGKNRIDGTNVYSIVDDYNDRDKNSIYPFTSWILTTNEYENFLHQ